VIIADTSVWAHHIQEPSADFLAHLQADQVLMHPWVIGELALGNLPKRAAFLKLLRALPEAVEARDEEVMEMIEINGLHGSGIGWVDIHLAASARLNKADLWTRDKRLFAVASRIGLPARGMH
jgi:predicted nucleic acid-binding protein